MFDFARGGNEGEREQKPIHAEAEQAACKLLAELQSCADTEDAREIPDTYWEGAGDWPWEDCEEGDGEWADACADDEGVPATPGPSQSGHPSGATGSAVASDAGCKAADPTGATGPAVASEAGGGPGSFTSAVGFAAARSGNEERPRPSDHERDPPSGACAADKPLVDPRVR